MSGGEIFAFILGVIKAIPIVDGWMKKLVALYIKSAQDGHDKMFAEALSDMLTTGSQVKLEEAMGNSNAGKPATRRTDVHERDRSGGGKLPIALILLGGLSLGSCVSRVDVEADVWATERLPQELCDRVPDLNKYGIFRVVQCKLVPKHPRCAVENPPLEFEEFIPYCSDTADKHVTMHEEDFNKWMDKLTRPKPSSKSGK
jgi:hypothetical protein